MPSPTPINTADKIKEQEDQFFADGALAMNKGDMDTAIQSFKKVLHLNLARQDVHYQLGLIYMNLGDALSAIDHFQSSVALLPNHIQSWINLGHARIFAGRFKEALSAARFARTLADSEKQNEPALIKLLAKALQPLEQFEVNRHIVEDMTACFTSPHIDKTPLVDIAQKLLMAQQVLQTALPKIQNGRIDEFETLLNDPAVNWPVLNHPLFVSLYMKCVIWLDPLEDFSAAMRAHILEYVAHEESEKLWPDSLIFTGALAQQCWINEYLYAHGDKQSAHLETVQARIEKALDSNQSPAPHDVAILACYKPLCHLPFAHALFHDSTLNENLVIREILRVQIAEPWEEHRILEEELQSFTAIEDDVSLKVKEQYEEFPYPRWVETAIERPITMRYLLNNQFPHLPHEQLPAEDINPQILIAGCGTGRQAIENRMLIQNADITAVDITAASLSYAMRKYKESGLDRIEFGLGDILKLQELNKDFDVVMCGGVLHHMHDPMAGWNVLEGITKPGGFMSIALYSEIARRNIVKAREYIEENKIANDEAGIHDIRAKIKALPDDDDLKALITHRDFYSLSECRDLLFHVQEHRFTCMQLKESIESLGLEFLGFQNMPPMTRRNYRAMFADDPHMIDLKNWHQYEEQYPDTFRGMYQFWLRKPD